MHRRTPLLIVIALVMGFIAGGVAVRASCSLSNCDYVPLVRGAGEVATPTLPPANNTCIAQLGVPDRAASSWLTNDTIVPGEPLSVCVYTGFSDPTNEVFLVIHQRSGDTQTPRTPIGSVATTIIPVSTYLFIPGELINITVYYGAQGSPHLTDQLYVLVQRR